MENQNFNPNEQLRVIREMIEKTKKETAENGWSLIMWGWLIFISAFSAYTLAAMGYGEISWYPWPILMPLGGIIQFVVEYKNTKRQKVRTYVERAIGWLWIGCGGAMFFIGFVALPAGIIQSWEAIAPIMCLFSGIGTMVTAKIINWNLLFYGSLLWFVAVGVMIFIPPFYHVLVMGITIIPAYLVPGYILRNKYKKA